MGQILIILVISLIGQYLSNIISFPIPRTIISSIILFLLLEFKILKVEYFREVVNISRKHLAFFFLPVGVGIMTQFDSRPIIEYFKVLLIMIFSTFLIMLFTGKLADIIIDIQERILGKSNLNKGDKNE
ncbi:CidA/LrgA family protein [Fusobacterium simiae]|uniref:CidA/LrgA family protein n=1 Tax=Fusobacterium TaxID=848 RepID=UPI000404D6A5|nr:MULTISPECIES: CidA/LrgA family protein [Fusobacterium]MDC7954606.1 CidA/LrgA family protein [Fusobacterium simiae]